jgi:hypothetical protein
MIKPAIAAIEQQLDQTLAKLKATKDPDLRRTYLARDAAAYVRT